MPGRDDGHLVRHPGRAATDQMAAGSIAANPTGDRSGNARAAIGGFGHRSPVVLMDWSSRQP
ncbi:hypothetical protein, partial [Nocardia gipuzkoensis]|uniref:hypothetical protein n=1 Tax=Nocardia gipuzkoensis TaxID=2749991 RepID=UPI001C670F91